MARPCKKQLRRFVADRSGNMAILLALSMPLALGGTALAIEGGTLFLKKTAVQAAADAAALSVGNAIIAGATTQAAAVAEGRAIVAAMGLANGENGVTVTVNAPPTGATYAGTTGAAEVLVSVSQPPTLSRLFHPANYTVTGRSIAQGAINTTTTRTTYGGGGCILALNTTGVGVNVGGTASLNAPKCYVYANSNSASSIYNNGGGFTKAKVVSAVGTVLPSGIVAESIVSYAPPIENPYSDLSVGTPPTQCASVTTNPLKPGNYCDGLTVNAGANVSLEPGVYYITSGKLTVNGGTLTGSGVTFVLTGSGKKYAYMNVAGNSVINITAPTSGPFAGVVVFADPAYTGNTQSLSGGASQYFGGAIVAPTSSVFFAGNGVASNGHNCTQIVGGVVSITGVSAVENDCASYAGVKPFGGAPTTITTTTISPGRLLQ
jgi:Flp pilus assembly protein TadG